MTGADARAPVFEGDEPEPPLVHERDDDVPLAVPLVAEGAVVLRVEGSVLEPRDLRGPLPYARDRGVAPGRVDHGPRFEDLRPAVGPRRLDPAGALPLEDHLPDLPSLAHVGAQLRGVPQEHAVVELVARDLEGVRVAGVERLGERESGDALLARPGTRAPFFTRKRSCSSSPSGRALRASASTAEGATRPGASGETCHARGGGPCGRAGRDGPRTPSSRSGPPPTTARIIDHAEERYPKKERYWLALTAEAASRSFRPEARHSAGFGGGPIWTRSPTYAPIVEKRTPMAAMIQ